MIQAANTVMIPREEYDALVQQRDALLAVTTRQAAFAEEAYDFVNAGLCNDAMSKLLELMAESTETPNVELTGSGQVHRPESSDRRERG